MLTTKEFYRKFPDEESCQNHLKTTREQEGVRCKKCDSKDHYWIKSKKQWQCKKCEFRTTLRSGTMFHASNVKLIHWYQTIYFMCATQKAISANEMRMKLGFKRYEPVWYMMHKIRLTMNSINSEIECENETYLNHCSLFNRAVSTKNFIENFFLDEPKKQSEVILLKDKRQRSSNKIRFKVFPMSKEYLDAEEYNQIFYTSELVKNAGITHRTAFDRNRSQLITMLNNFKEKKSRWVKHLFENLKGIIYTIHHSVSAKYLQLYLEEFSFKYNEKDTNCRWNNIIFKGLRFYW